MSTFTETFDVDFCLMLTFTETFDVYSNQDNNARDQ
jgi:hypothetical protein